MNRKGWKADVSEKRKRVEAIDLFKFIVLFFMIQGHLFRAFLLPSLRQGRWYDIHEILHGIVAPGFLFSAGFSAFLSFYKKRDQYTFSGGAFFTRMRRILFIIGIGYWMHLPHISLWRIIREWDSPNVHEFLGVSILQCIGTGLLLFQLLATLVKDQKWILGLVLTLVCIFFLLPGVVHDAHLPYVLKAYLSYNISPFPIFPWAGFLFLGVIVAIFFTRIKTNLFFRILLLAGLAMFPWYFLFKPEGIHLAELTLTGNLTKLGGVLLLLWLSNFLVLRCRGKVVDMLKKAGKESLFVYVLQSFVIFGSMFGDSLKRNFQDSLTLWPAIGLFFVVQAAVFALSLLYGYIKDKKSKIWRAGFILFWSLFFLVFLLNRN